LKGGNFFETTVYNVADKNDNTSQHGNILSNVLRNAILWFYGTTCLLELITLSNKPEGFYLDLNKCRSSPLVFNRVSLFVD